MKTIKEGLAIVRYEFTCEVCGHVWQDDCQNPKVSVLSEKAHAPCPRCKECGRNVGMKTEWGKRIS